MMGECEMRANARTAGPRRIVLVSQGGPLRAREPRLRSTLITADSSARNAFCVTEDRTSISHRTIPPCEILLYAGCRRGVVERVFYAFLWSKFRSKFNLQSRLEIINNDLIKIFASGLLNIVKK